MALVVVTGFRRNMNHIVMGRGDLRPIGMILGLIGVAVVVLSWVAAHYISWKFPRTLQHLQRTVSLPLERHSESTYSGPTLYQISPHFWPNGKMPETERWKTLAAGDFRDYKIKIGGLVERPVELSLADLKRLGTDGFITMHHCIQGFTSIAEWRSVPMREVVAVVKPKSTAKTVAFFSLGEELYGGTYYDTQTLDNVLKAECLLAFEMNGVPLPGEYGAPLRLRVENQLGYKMVKWIDQSNSSNPRNRLVKVKAARTKTMSISICFPISDDRRSYSPGVTGGMAA